MVFAYIGIHVAHFVAKLTLVTSAVIIIVNMASSSSASSVAIRKVWYTFGKLTPTFKRPSSLVYRYEPHTSYDIELVTATRYTIYSSDDDSSAMVFERGSTLTISKGTVAAAGRSTDDDVEQDEVGWTADLPGVICFEGIYKTAPHMVRDGELVMTQATVGDLVASTKLSDRWAFRYGIHLLFPLLLSLR